MYDEMHDRNATCPKCGYTYEGKYEMHRQDVQAIIEDGLCTWCYMYEEEKKDLLNTNPVAWATRRTLDAMGLSI